MKQKRTGNKHGRVKLHIVVRVFVIIGIAGIITAGMLYYRNHVLAKNTQEEKNQAIGCIQYLDCYIYFNSKGYVVDSEVREESETVSAQEVESTQEQQVLKPVENSAKSIPCIEGLDLEHVILNKKLPIKDEKILNTIMALNRMIEKNGIIPTRICFEEKNTIVLYYDEIRVQLGQDELLEEKITRVASILPDLSGMSGILHLENFSKSTKNIIFEKESIS